MTNRGMRHRLSELTGEEQPDAVMQPSDQGQKNMAVMMLEDGTYFIGTSAGARGEAMGELCFNTTMIGYPEVISDPANAGQIVVMTYPQIGNYGIATADLESNKASLRALVARDICDTPSNYRSEMSLQSYLQSQGIVAITDIDTRQLTQLTRTAGPLRAIVSTEDSDPVSLMQKLGAGPGISDENLVAEVSTDQEYLFEMNAEHANWYAELKPPYLKVIAIDLGITRSTLNTLVRMGCAVIVVPWNTSADDILAFEPNGVLLSSGPGDPRTLTQTIQTAAALMGKLPLLGIGLGHLVMALAANGEVTKMQAGHRGSNYPVTDLIGDKVSITAQNHGFSLLLDSLGTVERARARVPIALNNSYGRIQLTEVNLNDNSVEALLYLDVPAVSVQYLPAIPEMVANTGSVAETIEVSTEPATPTAAATDAPAGDATTVAPADAPTAAPTTNNSAENNALNRFITMMQNASLTASLSKPADLAGQTYTQLPTTASSSIESDNTNETSIPEQVDVSIDEEFNTQPESGELDGGGTVEQLIEAAIAQVAASQIPAPAPRTAPVPVAVPISASPTVPSSLPLVDTSVATAEPIEAVVVSAIPAMSPDAADIRYAPAPQPDTAISGVPAPVTSYAPTETTTPGLTTEPQTPASTPTTTPTTPYAPTEATTEGLSTEKTDSED